MVISWTRQAIEDIHSVREYYLNRSTKFTEEPADNFFIKADSLKQYPYLGRMVPEIENESIRELIFTVHNALRPHSERSIFE